VPAVPVASATPHQGLPPAAVIRRYERALESLPTPPYQVFEYSVDQVGWHDMAQRHRVYRAHGLQRDELMIDGGRAVSPPVVRIRRDVRDHYAVGNVAPLPAAYVFTFAGVAHVGSHLAYAFKTAPLGSPRAFAATRVVIDGVSYLPTSISFATRSNRADGAGTMLFAKAGPYCVPTRISVHATVDGKKATESITFSMYRFPRALPPATFKVGGASAVLTPAS